MSTMVIKMLPGQRKNPPSLLYPPTTHAVWESTSRRDGTDIRLIKFKPFYPSIVSHPVQKNALRSESTKLRISDSRSIETSGA